MASSGSLQELAKEHLWLHFTRMGEYEQHELPIIVRGDGCYLEDANGKRYLDGLAGLFSVNIGYGFGEEIGQAALEQMRELPFYTNWSYAHPRAIELAHAVAERAPGDLNRVFFCSGGSEAVESAWKLARQHYSARGEQRMKAAVLPAVPVHDHDALVAATGMPERRWKAVARHIAYHGTTMGALSINGIPAIRKPFEPLVPDVIHVRNTNRYHRPDDETEEQFALGLLDDLRQAIESALLLVRVESASGVLVRRPTNLSIFSSTLMNGSFTGQEHRRGHPPKQQGSGIRSLYWPVEARNLNAM